MNDEIIWEKFFYKISDGTWYHVKVVMNQEKDMFDVYIDNEKLVDIWTFQHEIMFEAK